MVQPRRVAQRREAGLGPPRFLGVREGGLVERRVGMAQAVAGKLAAVLHGVDRPKACGAAPWPVSRQ
jgi:hypothetical protein